jgi:hypothetical protein
MALHCLCCGSPVAHPRVTPLSDRAAAAALVFLTALGHTRDSLRTIHRDNIDAWWPGLSAALDAQAGAETEFGYQPSVISRKTNDP